MKGIIATFFLIGTKTFASSGGSDSVTVVTGISGGTSFMTIVKHPIFSSPTIFQDSTGVTNICVSVSSN